MNCCLTVYFGNMSAWDYCDRVDDYEYFETLQSSYTVVYCSLIVGQCVNIFRSSSFQSVEDLVEDEVTVVHRVATFSLLFF